MTNLFTMIKRNTKMFFKDKALFFTAMITPLILLVLYSTFLGNVYRDSFVGILKGTTYTEDVLDGLVAGQLVSSLLATACVTVAFCSNMLMVQDKVSGAHGDFLTTPHRPWQLAVAYFTASAFSTLVIAVFATLLGFIYLAVMGWYLSFADALLVLLDAFILTMFGTALSSIINSFLSSQGQISAVGSIVSSCYGFICGAYMPISQFSDGLQKLLVCLPGTYATSLLRNHTLRGATDELAASGVPAETLSILREMLDMEVDFFGTIVPEGLMFAIIGGSAAALILAYVLICVIRGKRKIR